MSEFYHDTKLKQYGIRNIYSNYQSDTKLHRAILKYNNAAEDAHTTAWAGVVQQGHDMSYYHNEEKAWKKIYEDQSFDIIQPECFQQLKYIKLWLDRIVSFDTFITKMPKLDKPCHYYFCIKTKDEITIEDANSIEEIINFAAEFIKSYNQNERLKRRRIKEKEEREKKEKEDAENLKKEYECMKLYNQVESSKMNSYELYQEYTKIKLLRDKFPSTQSGFIKNMFLDYFTDSKVVEIQKELDKYVVKEQPVCTGERIDDLEDNIIHHITAFSK